MRKFRDIDIIVIVAGVFVLVGNAILGYLYATGTVGHDPFGPVELFGFLQYAWLVVGAIALLLYLAALRRIIRPITILWFIALLALAGGLSRWCMMAASAAFDPSRLLRTGS